MSQLLTSRQAEELHKSMIAYFLSAGMTETATTLRQESNLESFDDATAKKYETLLEKKWTSVVRLQKKIIDLESKTQALQQELDSATPLSANRKVDPITWLPKSEAAHTFEGHGKPVNTVAFHPVRGELASGSEDATIRIWDWELGESLRVLKGHTRAVCDLDYGGPRGGTLLASCSSDLTIKLWDPNDDYKNVRTLPGHDHSVSSVRFIPSGAAGAPLSGNLLVSASRDKTLRIWDVTTGYCLKTLRAHTEWVRAVTPSIDGRWLLSAGNDTSPRLWDANSGEVKTSFEGHEQPLLAVAFAPANAYPHLAALAGYKKPPSLQSSGEFLATAGRDKLIKLWDNRGTCHATLVGHDAWITALVFHPGGRYLLSVCEDKTIRCWDLSQEARCVKVLDRPHEHFITDIRWVPDANIQVNGTAAQTNGDSTTGRKEDAGGGGKIRCILATASVDEKVRVFAA